MEQIAIKFLTYLSWGVALFSTSAFLARVKTFAVLHMSGCTDPILSKYVKEARLGLVCTVAYVSWCAVAALW